MHAKLHLLRHENFLRVVISSANQTKGDWDSVVQISWVCDFARVPAGGGRRRPSLFAAELARLYPSPASRPKLLGPDVGYLDPREYLGQFLGNFSALHAVTYGCDNM